MNRMDLRQAGTIRGLPIYVDFANIRDVKLEGEVLGTRDMEEILILKTLSGLLRPKEKENI